MISREDEEVELVETRGKGGSGSEMSGFSSEEML